MPERRASWTAVMVCQGRAAAHERIAPGVFEDPTALALLRPDERQPVLQVRDGQPPAGWAERMDYESVRVCAEMMAPRTVAIDEAVRLRRTPQVVILGAGLDGRAWRMPHLAGVAVFEVDQPASQRDKRDRARGLNGIPPQFVPVDFGQDDLDGALETAGHRVGGATTWIWEGVVPYLTRAETAVTLTALAGRSAPGSRVIVNYQAPSLRAVVGQSVVKVLAATTGRRNPWAAEPWRATWTPAAMSTLLAGHGFTVTADENLFDIAARLNLAPPSRTSFRSGRVAVADKDQADKD